VSVLVFPELSLTGYELDADPVSPSDPALAPIVDACTESGSIAFVGAPVAEDGRASIAMLRVDAEGVAVAYRKTFLGGDELRRFTPGDGATAVEVDGWRLGLGICKDTGIREHAAATSALGMDAYVAGVLEAAADASVPDVRARRIAVDHGVWVAMASFAGSTGGGYDAAAGCSGIWAPDGHSVARVGPEPGALAKAALI